MEGVSLCFSVSFCFANCTCVTIVDVTINPGNANPYEIFFTVPPADPRAGEAT